MGKSSGIFLVSTAIFLAGCKNQPPAHDLTTPEGAILCLEDAYQAKDIEAAIQCKDFRIEARLMMQKFKNLPEGALNNELITKTAEVLEQAYRKEMEKKGFPDFTGAKFRFPKVETYQEGVMIVTEERIPATGQANTQRILVGKRYDGWRVLNVVN